PTGSPRTLKPLCREERREPARTIEGHEVLVAADMALADINLRHGPPTRPLHHLHATRRIEIDANLGDFADAFGAQIALRPNAIRTDRRRIHENCRRPGDAHVFCTGSPASFHALK